MVEREERRRAPQSPGRLTIEQLADAGGLTVRNVRAYQQKGLLPPPQREGRRSLYDQEHVARLRMVRALHSYGLTLRTIGDLIDRGAADAELAERSRDAVLTGWRRGVRVPLHPENVALFERTRPGAIEEMERAGLISRPDGRPHANAAGLGVVAALAARGVDLDVGTRLVLAGAYAAHDAADRMDTIVDGVDGVGGGPTAAPRRADDASEQADERVRLMAQLVATAFADVLVGRLLHGAEPPPDDDRNRHLGTPA